MSDSLEPTIRAAILAERLEGHERICAERYGEITKSFDRVHSRLDWIMRCVLGLLAAMLGWVVTNGVPWLTR